MRRFFRIGVRRRSLTRADIDAEIEFHLLERVDQLVARGYTADDARAEASRRFGEPLAAREQLVASAQRRESRMRLREIVDALVHDTRVAVRGFRRQPGFVLVAVLTLALGIGANATVFTWMEGLVLNPLPAVKNADRLVALTTGLPSGSTQSISFPDYLDWQHDSRTLGDVVGYRRQQFSLRVSNTADARPVWGVLASANYFDVLGLRPFIGRAFRADESAPTASAGSAPIVILGYDLWRRDFGGRTDVLGRELWLDGHPLTVIGVAPPGFRGTNVGFGFDLWVPLTMQPALLAQPAAKLTWRRSRWMNAFARLAPGATLAQATAELDVIGRRIAAAHVEDKGTRPVVTPLFQAEASGILEPAFLALLGATVLVLLIVCFNLAGLQLVRATARQQELAIRMALGASRWRIVQQSLIEAALLAAAGTPAALAVALWARQLLAHFMSNSTFPLADTPGLDLRVFGVTAAAALFVVLLIGTWPALRVSRVAKTYGLTGRTGRGITRHGHVREALVVAQLALSLVGVASAGLLVRSLGYLRGIDTGLVDPRHVLLMSTDFDLAGEGYAGFDDNPSVRARRLPIAMEILRRARALPGVRDAALTDSPPLGLITGFDSFDADVPGYVPKPGESRAIEIGYATPAFFTTVGPPIIRGRGFLDSDRAGDAFATVVTEAFARRFWPGADPASAAVGKEIRAGSRTMTVIGVVRDGKYHFLTEPPHAFFYLAYAQWSPSAFTIAVRTTGNPLSVAEPLRRIFHEVDPRLPFFAPRTLADQVDGALTLQRLGATLLASIGVLALAIAGLGLYGALAQAVQQRRQEIGIRLALGARAADVLRQFTKRGLVLAGAGIVLGIPGVVVAARLLRGQIYGIGPADAVALAGTAMVFVVVALVASLSTAARAAAVDPATSIRAE